MQPVRCLFGGKKQEFKSLQDSAAKLQPKWNTDATDINDQVVSGQELYDSMMQRIDVQLKNLQLRAVEILRFTMVIRKSLTKE